MPRKLKEFLIDKTITLKLNKKNTILKHVSSGFLVNNVSVNFWQLTDRSIALRIAAIYRIKLSARMRKECLSIRLSLRSICRTVLKSGTKTRKS